MGFITSPSPSNTTEGREGGRQRGRKEAGGELLSSFSASNGHTLSTSPLYWLTILHGNRIGMSLRMISLYSYLCIMLILN